MSSENPSVNKDSTDDNFKRREEEKEYQERVKAEYQKLKINPISLQKAILGTLENYEVKDFSNIFQLLYEFYTYGITPEVLRVLTNFSNNIGVKLDSELYDRAKYIVYMVEKGRQQPTK